MGEGPRENTPGYRATATTRSGDAAINWTVATFAAAIAAGVLWATVLYTGEHHPITSSDIGWFPPSVLMIAGIACAVLACTGAVILKLTHRSRTRTVGAALVILAAIGPVVAIATRLILAEALLLGALLLASHLRRRRGTPAQIQPSSRRPIWLLCGLLIGIQIAYFVWIFLAIYAPLVLALLAFILTIPARTRSFATGLLAAGRRRFRATGSARPAARRGCPLLPASRPCCRRRR